LSANGHAQNIVLTREQNCKWLDSLKKLKLGQQLLMINERLLADTGVFVRQFYNDGIKIDEQIGDRVYGDGKPAIIIGGYLVIIDNKTPASKIVSLTKYLTTEVIKEISILNPNESATAAIYGLRGRSGVIIMALKKRKHLKKFKKMNLQSNGYRYT
jgi:hypothetical protein